MPANETPKIACLIYQTGDDVNINEWHNLASKSDKMHLISLNATDDPVSHRDYCRYYNVDPKISLPCIIIANDKESEMFKDPLLITKFREHFF